MEAKQTGKRKCSAGSQKVPEAQGWRGGEGGGGEIRQKQKGKIHTETKRKRQEERDKQKNRTWVSKSDVLSSAGFKPER